MKISYALALAAAAEQASATGIVGDLLKTWLNVDPYTCPGKKPVVCAPGQVPGHHYGDVPDGPVGNYGGCKYENWTCKKKYGRRDMLAGRKDDGSKVIEAECGSDGDSGNPVISAGQGVNAIDIRTFSVQAEYNARFEFHYSMGDGSTCKQSCPVSTEGTSIVNTQCGGAKSVKIVLPRKQLTKTIISKCKIKCSGINFWCIDKPPKTTSSPPATPPAQTSSITVSTVRPTTSKQTTPPGVSTSINTPPGVSTSISTPPAQSTSTNTPPGVSTSINTPPGVSTSTNTGVSTSTNTPPGASTSINTPPGVSTSTNTPPGVTTSTETPPGVTTSINTPPGVTTSINTPPGVTTSINTPPGTPPSTTTSFTTTTYETISTVFTTSTKTITSCGPEITSCPIKTPGEIGTVTITSIVSTTICPVTETRPVVITTQTQPGASQTQPTQSPEKPQESQTKTSPPVPSQSLPCPESVPRCLKSWLDLVKECDNNANADCFCKNGEFTDKVFQCLYSYGGSDKDIADSISFFQGICGKHAGENPNIVLGPSTITEIITATPAPLPSASVSTITVDTTITVPCVTSGTTISGSSTTSVISTEVPVPVVTLTPPPSVPTGGKAPTTVAPGVPVGTGVPTAPSGTQPPIVVGGAGKAQAGILGAIIMALVAAL